MAALVEWSEEKDERQVACAFGVPKSSLNYRLRGKHSGKWPRYTLLSLTCEMLLVTIILFMA